MPEFDNLRQTMVDTQLRTNKVIDERILEAMGDIPRERFVPAGWEGLAYIDEDIAISDARFLLEPMVLARMIQATDVQSEDVVLDIANGAGYSSAVLSRIARAVVAVESDLDLVKSSTEKMVDLGMDNVVIELGAIEDGWPDQAPYDVILVNGACGKVPEVFFKQLSDGGRLCAVTKGEAGAPTAILWTKLNGIVSDRPLFDANIPALPELKQTAGFIF